MLACEKKFKMDIFLINCGLEGAVETFVEHGIELSQIFELNDYGDLLKELLPKVGDRLKLLKAIKEKPSEDEDPPPALTKRKKRSMDNEVNEATSSRTHSENQAAVITILRSDKTMSNKLNDMAKKMFENFNSNDFEICHATLIDFTNGMVLCPFCGIALAPHIRKDRPASGWHLGNVMRHLNNFHKPENATEKLEEVKVNSMLEVIINSETVPTRFPFVRLTRFQSSCDDNATHIEKVTIDKEHETLEMEIDEVNETNDSLRLNTEKIDTLASKVNTLASVEDESVVIEIDAEEMEQIEEQQLNALPKDSSEDKTILHVKEDDVPATNVLENDTPSSAAEHEQSVLQQGDSEIEQQQVIALYENETASVAAQIENECEDVAAATDKTIKGDGFEILTETFNMHNGTELVTSATQAHVSTVLHKFMTPEALEKIDLLNFGEQSITPFKLDKNDIDGKLPVKSPGVEHRSTVSSTSATLYAEASGKDRRSFEFISSHPLVDSNSRLSVVSLLHDEGEPAVVTKMSATQDSPTKVSRCSRSAKRTAKYVQYLSDVREIYTRPTSKRSCQGSKFDAEKQRRTTRAAPKINSTGKQSTSIISTRTTRRGKK